MSLSQVRARVQGNWYALTYNEQTAAYEAEIIPVGTSYHEPGGVYIAEVEAVNDTGASTQVDGNIFRSLQLKVLESDAPMLAFISPGSGILTTALPTVIVDAVDEVGGSGIDLTTLKLYLDGVAVPFVTTVIDNGWRATFTPSEPLAEGKHVFTASVADNDGNVSGSVAEYVIDTVPPVLQLDMETQKRVTDCDSVQVAGWCTDATTGVASLTVTGGAESVSLATGDAGRYIGTVPLNVGVNDLTFTAVDVAGLATVQSFRVIRLITDRALSDVKWAEYANAATWDNLNDDEKARYLTWRNKGVYTHIDLNRVGDAETLLKELLNGAGYNITGSYKTSWARDDAFSRTSQTRYVDGVREISDKLPHKPHIPSSLDALEHDGANEIEAALVAADEMLGILRKSYITSGEFESGGF